jgi:hypothetical protein
MVLEVSWSSLARPFVVLFSLLVYRCLSPQVIITDGTVSCRLVFPYSSIFGFGGGLSLVYFEEQR